MHRHTHLVVAGLVGAGLWLAACGSGSADYGEISQSGPVRLSPIPGSDLVQVTLTPESAQKLGVRTSPVASAVSPALADSTSTQETTVPVDAVIYDKDGNTWVYVVDGPRSFERRAVSLERVDGDTAVLKSGPPPGTKVVVVGAQELMGAELGVAGE